MMEIFDTDHSRHSIVTRVFRVCDFFSGSDLSVASSNSHESHTTINRNCHPNAAITTILRRRADFCYKTIKDVYIRYMLVFFNEKTDNITFAGIRCAHRKRKLFRRNYVVFLSISIFETKPFFCLFSISIWDRFFAGNFQWDHLVFRFYFHYYCFHQSMLLSGSSVRAIGWQFGKTKQFHDNKSHSRNGSNNKHMSSFICDEQQQTFT